MNVYCDYCGSDYWEVVCESCGAVFLVCMCEWGRVYCDDCIPAY